MVYWEGHPRSFALHYPYVLAFEPTFVEVRHVETGQMTQIIQGNNLRLLFADTPPSTTHSSAQLQQYNPYQQGYGYGQYGQQSAQQQYGGGQGYGQQQHGGFGGGYGSALANLGQRAGDPYFSTATPPAQAESPYGAFGGGFGGNAAALEGPGQGYGEQAAGGRAGGAFYDSYTGYARGGHGVGADDAKGLPALAGAAASNSPATPAQQQHGHTHQGFPPPGPLAHNVPGPYFNPYAA